MSASFPFVSAVLASAVRVESAPAALIASLGITAEPASEKDAFLLGFSSESELSMLLQLLRDKNFAFLDEPAGWPPAAVFSTLRERGLVFGLVRSVAWRSPGMPVFSEL